MPQQCSEVEGQQLEDNEDPFFVLLEDDKVIYELTPEEHEPERDVFAIIRVRTKTFSGDRFNIHDQGA